jgi:Mrp family chromosome partitioning ATPase/capsular polysaccharide biosynthesis protein
MDRKRTQTGNMEHGEGPEGPRTLVEYLAVVRRRKWIALIPVLLVPLAAFGYALQQPKLYGASSEVLLSRDDLGSVLAGRPSANAYTDPARFAQTQAALARVPEVARRAVVRAKSNLTPGALLAASTVTPRGNADLLRFSVTTGDPRSAAELATTYAQAFAQYRLELDTASLTSARADLERNLDKLSKQGTTDTALYRSLVEKEQELRTLELLQTKPQVVTSAVEGAQVAPTPKRNAILGLAIGLFIGLAAAFLWESLDRRVRDESEIERALGIPLLARLPAPRQIKGNDRLAMLDGASGAESEAVRRLRSNFELANLDVNAHVIMVTSAVSGEGKSITVANLAVALARSGRKVVLVDLDLRKPSVGRLMGFGYRPGVTEVAINRIELERALIPVPLDSSEPIELASRGPHRASRGRAEQAGGSAGSGQLSILPAGFLPASPGELIGTRAIANILAELRADADFVLVDAPPLLAVSDALTLSGHVDALLIVVRLGTVDRPMLRELARQLEVSPAHKLGWALAGDVVAADYSYGYEGYGREDRGRTSIPSQTAGIDDLAPRETPAQRA